ncbi:hypothetical protein QTG54_011187 [Skeletonema marinoi]|uniref:Uncharacterized protein n=1 Tax=Skeletonema marinoi TaxID=267567 RepID=A0AAD9D9P7_9STRA|nr:hypothetical protein QTG54_011187 [Skeletonema marinoi]
MHSLALSVMNSTEMPRSLPDAVMNSATPVSLRGCTQKTHAPLAEVLPFLKNSNLVTFSEAF